MAVKIRLKRMGKIRAPFYRVVIMDSRTKRDGRAIEEIGKYHPTADPSVIEIDSARAQHWLTTGAQPTEAVEALLKVTGDWQKFKGLPGTEGTLKVAEPKRSKRDVYEAAIAAAGGSTLDAKDAPARKKAAPAKKAAASTSSTPTAEPAQTGEATPADATPADATPADATPADATPAQATPAAADTDSGAAAAQSTDTSDDPKATEAHAAETTPDTTPDTTADTASADTPETAAADGGYGADSAAPNEDGSAPTGFDVKGNKDSMKYHEPDGQWYGQTVAEVWFTTAEAAEKAGFTRAGH